MIFKIIQEIPEYTFSGRCAKTFKVAHIIAR